MNTPLTAAELQSKYSARTDQHAAYWVLDALLAGEIVEVEGIPVRKADGDLRLQRGDLYVGARNNAFLLTVDRVDRQYGCVYNEERAYPFDIVESIKVVAVL